MATGKYQKWLTPESLTLLEGWARDGATDEQIAHNMGIRRETLYDWKNKYPNISNAIKKGKEVVDIEVENALLRRALGCRVTEETIEDVDGRKKKRVVRKEVPPDSAAAIFWLRNRRPDRWSNNPTNEDNRVLEQLDGLMEAFKDATK